MAKSKFSMPAPMPILQSSQGRIPTPQATFDTHGANNPNLQRGLEYAADKLENKAENIDYQNAVDKQKAEDQKKADAFQGLLMKGVDGMKQYAADVATKYPELGKQFSDEVTSWEPVFKAPGLTADDARQATVSFYQSANGRLKAYEGKKVVDEETRKAKLDLIASQKAAMDALTALRARTDPNLRGGSGHKLSEKVDQKVLEQSLTDDYNILQSAGTSLVTLESSQPSTYDSQNYQTWKEQMDDLQLTIKAARDRIGKNKIFASDTTVISKAKEKAKVPHPPTPTPGGPNGASLFGNVKTEDLPK